MYKLLKLFFDICLLKKGPQDIPVSQWLLPLLIPVYAGVSFLMLTLDDDAVDTVLHVIVELALILGLTAIILFFANKRSRYQQTASALMATDALIGFLTLPALATLAIQSSGLAVLALILLVLLMLWSWVVSGHIFSQALEQPFIFGLGVAFLYILVSYQVIRLLFPELFVVE